MAKTFYLPLTEAEAEFLLAGLGDLAAHAFDGLSDHPDDQALGVEVRDGNLALRNRLDAIVYPMRMRDAWASYNAETDLLYDHGVLSWRIVRPFHFAFLYFCTDCYTTGGDL